MKKQFLFTCLLIISSISYGQVAATSAFYKTLKTLDSLVFEEGFNKCRLSVYDSIVSDDIEFYHDKGGVTNWKEAFITSVKNDICGTKNKIRRELVNSSIEVHPLYNNNILYGAIQQGVHKFFTLENSYWQQGSTAKFTHLWLFENGKWKLKHVLSYNH